VGSGKRNRSQDSVPSPSVPAPFHSPFRDLAGIVRVPSPSATSSSRKGAAPTKTAAGAPVADASLAVKPSGSTPPSPSIVPPAPSDADLLVASRAGVAPIAAGAVRVVVRRRPDLSSIEAKRQQDLAELARAEGFDVTYEDRYVRARASGVSFETLARLEKGEFPISAHLDLHGFAFEDARRAVDDFLAAQQKRGRRCVLLVTGKGKNSPNGQGVLRERLPEWLARGPSSRRVLAFASARPCDGGLGALVVLMRADSSSKNRIHVEHGGVGPLKT
jgi:DNA-nicking Smr family endonuclease